MESFPQRCCVFGGYGVPLGDLNGHGGVLQGVSRVSQTLI